MSRIMKLKTGGQITLTACDDQRVTLESEFASPPGSTLELIVCDAPVSVKVRACRRADDPSRFIVEGRWVNLSRVQRTALNI